MTSKKAATSAKHKTATKKHAASKKHTESKAQLAHLHVLHVEHTEHVAHMAAIGKPVTVKAKQPAHAKATKAAAFAVGDWLPVCSFEAVAMSLRLAGQRVHDDEVAGLWHLLGERPEGVPVGEALAAAALFGLAGYRPAFEEVHGSAGRDLNPRQPFNARPARCSAAELPALPGLILGVDRPGPHAVLATADGWWSWGELFSPWRCHVSEAWAVSWS